MMEIRRATLGAAIRLAIAFSAMAAIVTVALDAVADVSVIGMVTVVSVVGFATSWVQTGRVSRTVAARPSLARVYDPVA